jgi:hypothetical protein
MRPLNTRWGRGEEQHLPQEEPYGDFFEAFRWSRYPHRSDPSVGLLHHISVVGQKAGNMSGQSLSELTPVGRILQAKTMQVFLNLTNLAFCGLFLRNKAIQPSFFE